LDHWRSAFLQVDLPERGGRIELTTDDIRLDVEPMDLEPVRDPEWELGALTPEASKKTTWRTWKTGIKNHLYQEATLTLWKSPEFKLVSEPGEARETFERRVQAAAEEARDELLAKTQDRFESKLSRARERVRKAEQKVEVQEDQYDSVRTSTWARVGGLVMSLFTKKRTRSEVAAAARSASRARKEKSDIHRAENDLDQCAAELAALERELEQELEVIRRDCENRNEEWDEVTIAPRKSDIHFETFALVWRPESI
jgi:hypothetical protein